MAEKIRFGIFGTGEVTRDDDGFIEIPVIIQESGLYGGAPPLELRIHAIGIYDGEDFNKAYVAKLNRRTDLPFYFAKAKVKIVGKVEKITDENLKALGIEPLSDEPNA